MQRYSVVLMPGEEHGYTVVVPELPGCITEGDTIEEALANAREAIECHLEGLAADGEPAPLEPPGLLLTSVDVSPGLADNVAPSGRRWSSV